jgi:hypothetical protein
MNRTLRLVGGILFVLLPIFLSCATTQQKNTLSEETNHYYDREIELNGFFLHQCRQAVELSLKPAFEKMEKDFLTYEIHLIDDEAYMVFGYPQNMPQSIFSIQLTGKTSKMKPFKGLMLGDSREKVIEVLGKPSSIEPTDVAGVQRYEYKSTNYSVEINVERKLYSIRISSYKDLQSLPKTTELPWEGFKRSVLKRDFKEISTYLRPDVEIYKGDKVLFINKSFREFIENPDSEFYDALVGEKNSVYSEIQQTEPEWELRFTEKVGVGWVYKFYKGKILREIFFLPYDGRYRVYEMAFRDSPKRQ